jgi:glycosyltransferase involved in cell wall biosynthesis
MSSTTNCQLCLQADGLLGTERNARLLISRRILSAIDKIICSTKESSIILAGFFSGIEDKISIIQMLTPNLDELSRIPKEDKKQATSTQPFLRLARASALRVIIIGNQGRHKGFDSLLRIMNNLRFEDIEFRILGTDAECIDTINAMNFGKICQTSSGYDRKTLLHALANSDVALSLSTWPETYNISLGEAMAAGVVPIATNIGAHKDRICHRQNGFLADTDADVVDLLKILRADRKLLALIKANLVEIKEISAGQHTSMLLKLYTSIRYIVPISPALQTLQGVESKFYLDLEYQLNSLMLDFRSYSTSALSVETIWD